MDNVVKITTVLLVFTTGCTCLLFTEPSKLRCYKSIDDYAEYDSTEIEKMMNSTYFTKDICTFLWIHGFNATITGPAITTMVTGALNKGGWNVCVWNWVNRSRSYDLIGPELSFGEKVVAVVQSVGYEMGGALAKVADKGLNFTCLHIYAHSLGAHVAGYCGQKLKYINAQPIEWTLGADPAGPLYGNDGVTIGKPLSTGDARHVFCLHSDPGNNGINSSNCDMDIWVNYLRFLSLNQTERVQPGCPENYTNRFSDAGYCSHNYCWKLLNASFVYDFYISYGPDYWTWTRSNGTATPITLLGEKTDTTLHGNYFFSALPDYPYTLGMDGLRPYYY